MDSDAEWRIRDRSDDTEMGVVIGDEDDGND